MTRAPTIAESLARLAEAFGVREARAASYIAELVDCDPDRLARGVTDCIRQLDRFPSIAELRRRASGPRVGRRLTPEETRALIERRLRWLELEVTEDRVRAHWSQFYESFNETWALLPAEQNEQARSAA